LKIMRMIPAVAAAAALALAATGCTVSSDEDKPADAGGGSIKKVDSVSGKKIRVGSKEFDEQLLLGQIAIVALEATGAKPVDKTNITGSDNVRKALTTNSIDLYWEYTGTGWTTYLKKTQVIPNPVKLYDATKKADAAEGVTWWARSPANDTYALVANGEAAKKLNITSISDYAALVKKNPAQAKTCLGPEFKSRDDGISSVEKKYGFKLPTAQIKVLADAVVYPTVGKGETCSFASVASTDGRIPAQKLVLLKDDKQAFPVYNPAITIRSSVAKKYPELEKVFAPIATKLDSKTLTDLNKKVSVDGEKPKKVAQDWLKKEGFIS
jgi:osmoprotectant transport system substrate-binding protein